MHMQIYQPGSTTLEGHFKVASNDPEILPIFFRSSTTGVGELASDVIRRMDETVRSREAQVRELLECEREFQKIAGEMHGSDVLGQLDGLEQLEYLSEIHQVVEPTKTEHRHHLDTLEEETTIPTS